MQLDNLTYSEHEGQGKEWILNNCILGKINLIVGKNAVGKTRFLNTIKSLADLVSGERKVGNANYNVKFSDDSQHYQYFLHFENGSLKKEQLDIDDETLMVRGEDGSGEIFFEEIGNKHPFQSPTNEVAVFARRDSVQHPYLDNLYQWGKNLRKYDFGTSLGRDVLAVYQEAKDDKPQVNLKDYNQIVSIFQAGVHNFSNIFVDNIKDDMRHIGYDIESIRLSQTIGLNFTPPAQPYAIHIKERNIDYDIPQIHISQGMFRAFSIIAQINYSILAGTTSCILVDDIGEGLDYERSIKLKDLMIEKSQNNSVQLIMATNDRFVMNKVPLEYWIILHRKGNQVYNYSYHNSKALFDKFETTGLNNFDLFASEHYLKSQDH